MTFVITSSCVDVKDQSCVEVCPADCIYGDEEDRSLYINRSSCLNCLFIDTPKPYFTFVKIAGKIPLFHMNNRL